jgi:hypothetical protein
VPVLASGKVDKVRAQGLLDGAHPR